MRHVLRKDRMIQKCRRNGPVSFPNDLTLCESKKRTKKINEFSHNIKTSDLELSHLPCFSVSVIGLEHCWHIVSLGELLFCIVSQRMSHEIRANAEVQWRVKGCV